MKKINLFVIFTFFLSVCLSAYYCINIYNNIKYTSSEQSNINSIPTVIIDAGHGGDDGGAIACDGSYEKVLNLQIAMKLAEFLKTSGVKIKMTRTTDESIHNNSAKSLREKKVSDIHNRMRILEDTPNSIFVSIHQNKYSNASQWGTQVFYSPNTTGSAELANQIQNVVRKNLQPENQRNIKKSGSNIYLLYYAKKDAVLVECGFISNPKELHRLQTEEYQNQLAFSIACGILEFLNTKVV